MIRTACLAATLLAGALLPAASASAAISINSRISQIVDVLRSDSQFNRSNFSFSVNTPGGSTRLFKGLSGARNFNNVVMLNEWVAKSGKKSAYQSGSYQFTHGVLDSYFGDGGDKSAYEGGRYKFTHSVLGSYFDDEGEDEEKSPYEGGQYKFTHSALDSYFGDEPDSSPAEPAAFMRMAAPEDERFRSIQSVTVVPEPASWAMMIVGMGFAGAMMRRYRRASFA